MFLKELDPLYFNQLRFSWLLFLLFQNYSSRYSCHNVRFLVSKEIFYRVINPPNEMLPAVYCQLLREPLTLNVNRTRMNMYHYEIINNLSLVYRLFF